MKAILVLGLLTGIDNLQVTPALGLLRMSHRRRFAWALMFGLAEALMPLVGLLLGGVLRRSFASVAEILGPASLVLCGLVIFALALREDDLEKVTASRWTLVGFPLTLSLDNLFAGIGVGAAGAPPVAAALCIGGVSMSLSLVGLYAGHFLRRFLPTNAEYFSGGYLVLLGVGGFFWSPLT